MARLRRETLVAAFLGSFFFVASANADSVPEVIIKLGENFGEFFVVNQGAKVCLQSIVVVEEKSDDHWHEIPVSNLELREACLPSPPPSSVEIGASATLHPLPWTGSFCRSQCSEICRLDGPIRRGSYRFTVTTCDGKHKFSSPALEKTKGDYEHYWMTQPGK